MNDKGYYSVKGVFKKKDKMVFEERNYFEASTFEEALEMAKEDGNLGSGMAFFNLNKSEECCIGELNLEKFLAKIYLEKSKN